MIPAILLSPLARWGAILALAVAIWGHGWVRGAGHAEKRAEAVRVAQEAAALKHAQELARRGDEITVVWLRGQREIEERIRKVEVTKYVKPDVPVPVGLVRLWDDSAGVQARIYQPASGIDDAAGDVALVDLGRGILEARRRFELNRAQCVALQEWAKRLE